MPSTSHPPAFDDGLDRPGATGNARLPRITCPPDAVSLIAKLAASPSWKWKLSIALLSVALTTVAAEGLLRWILFHTSLALAAKDPAFYARSLDEVWVYRHLFVGGGRDGMVPDQPVATRDTGIEFYRRWPASLEPDARLGYVRKANVRIPCHETTNLATRGTRDYAPDTPKIAFFGDSFVESAACSNDTLTTKLEALTGIDTLNYGVGGYGLDQIFLSFDRVRPLLDRDDRLVLIGLIQDDLDRTLLTIRTSPKPYFTVDGDRLDLHVEHIHPASLGDAFVAPAGRFYLVDLLRGRFGTPAYTQFLRETKARRREAVDAISRLVFTRFAEAQRRGSFGLAFVLLPTPGAPFDPQMAAAIRERGLALVDLQDCLRASGRPDTDLYAELHPTSLGNALLAQCLVGDLRALRLLRR